MDIKWIKTNEKVSLYSYNLMNQGPKIMEIMGYYIRVTYDDFGE